MSNQTDRRLSLIPSPRNSRLFLNHYPPPPRHPPSHPALSMGLTAGTIKKGASAVNVRSPFSPAYYQPFTNPPSGTLLSKADWPQNAPPPLLFQPITIGKGAASLTLKNRIMVAPMCECESQSQLLETRVSLGSSSDAIIDSAEPGTGIPGPWQMVRGAFVFLANPFLR